MSLYSGSIVSESEFDPADERWDDWYEEDSEDNIKCLFCPLRASTSIAIFHHCIEEHNFDFMTTRAELNLDFYQCIRLINYIRKKVIQDPTLGRSGTFQVSPDDEFLFNDEYMLPTMENDSLLYVFEDLDDMPLSVSVASFRHQDVEQPSMPKLELEHLDSRAEHSELLRQLRLTEMKLKQSQKQLEELKQQHKEYREMVKHQFYDKIDDFEQIDKAKDQDYYFRSYAHLEIHEDMLKDTVRTDSYRDFVYGNKRLFDQKVVLDVGCGTGILSMFSAKAGAKKVLAVDNSSFIEKTKEIVKKNGLEDQIMLIKGKIESVELPESSVDIIISEWMGYFLLFEGMLDSVIYARDKYLAPGGIMAPNKCSLYLNAIQDDFFIGDKYDFWSSVYGFDMSTLTEDLYEEAIVRQFNPESLLGDNYCLKTFDLMQCTVKDLDFETAFKIQFNRNGMLQAFLGHFDINFSGPSDASEEDGQSVYFSTSAQDKPTHWKQVAFVLRDPIPVKKGQEVVGKFSCEKSLENPRELLVSMEFSLVDPAMDPCCYHQTFFIR